MTSGLNFNLTTYGSPRLLANEVSQAISEFEIPDLSGMCLKKKKRDVFGTRLTGGHKIKEDETYHFFFSLKNTLEFLGIRFLSGRKEDLYIT